MPAVPVPVGMSTKVSVLGPKGARTTKAAPIKAITISTKRNRANFI
jgi:hypothetical protein